MIPLDGEIIRSTAIIVSGRVSGPCHGPTVKEAYIISPRLRLATTRPKSSNLVHYYFMTDPTPQTEPPKLRATPEGAIEPNSLAIWSSGS